VPSMSDELTPATPEDLSQALAFALKFDGRRRIHTGDDLMAKLMAEHLVKYLASAGYVVMKKPPTRGHSAGSGPPPPPR
jgi:hypothetical protein